MIVLFSGTGNSLHVANLLSEELGDKIVRLPYTADCLPQTDNNRVIWVFPVYSWGIPPVVARWISRLQIPGANDASHHAVMTCGDDIGQADKMWRKAVEKRGWKTAGAYSVQMPNTYVLMKGFDVDSPELAESKIKAAGPRVRSIAQRIEAMPGDAQTDVVRGGFAWIKTKVIYPYFTRFEMSPKPFHPTDACVGCGICAKACPMTNILMTEGHPQWGTNCALCLGCYHACPHHAVAYGKATLGKGRKQILTK